MDRDPIHPDPEKIHFYLGEDTIPSLLAYLHNIKAANLVLVSDQNQYKALGSKVELWRLPFLLPPDPLGSSDWSLNHSGRTTEKAMS